jgi:AraC family transcriptional regulator
VWKSTQPDTEICVDIHGNGSVITRHGGGILDRTVAERGTAWLCPAGLQEDFIEISDPVPDFAYLLFRRAISHPTALVSTSISQ